MNKPYKNIPIILFIIGLGCSLYFFFSRPQPETKDVSCVKLPVSFFPFSRQPLIQVEIEGKKYTLLIDTGSSHRLGLHKRVLERFGDKEFLGVANYLDFKGNPYQIEVFRTPPVKLHKSLEISGLDAQEENIDFLTSGASIQKTRSLFSKIRDQLRLLWIDGRIGFSPFRDIAAHFDFPHRCLYLGKNLKALEQEGIFQPNDFVALPFAVDHSGPVISLETNLGEKKFLLDTGATHSIINATEDSSLNLKVNDTTFGSWYFFYAQFSPKVASEFDGVLGVDFFKKHAICFDFQQGIVYIQK